MTAAAVTSETSSNFVVGVPEKRVQPVTIRLRKVFARVVFVIWLRVWRKRGKRVWIVPL